MMNKKTLPLAFSTLFLALVGCGGEEAKINEDPNRGVKTSSNGCDNSDSRCLGFTLDYPVGGLNFNCSNDKNNNFVTEMTGNIVSGGCLVGDTVSFYIQGETSEKKIELGSVDLKTISEKKVAEGLIQINLQDLAQGLTGTPIKTLDMSDPTYRVGVRITRLLQAIGVQQKSNVPGNIQYMNLTRNIKNELTTLEKNVLASDFVDGTYDEDLKPWTDVSIVSEQQAEKVFLENIRLRSVSIFSANYLPLLSSATEVAGFYGKNLGETQAIANLYMLTTRQGYGAGYIIQWRGIPITTGNQQGSPLARVNLVTQVSPTRLDLYSNSKDWISLTTQKIQNPLKFKTLENSSDELEIYKGKLFSQLVIPGNKFMYQRILNVTGEPSDQGDYGEWRQDINSDRFTGKLDILKTNPVTYLDRNIFKTENSVNAGEKYIFPLYADLIFKFDDSSIPSETVSIVIDKYGDIRTNKSANSLKSTTCSALVDEDTMLDEQGVKQLRIGTTGTVNSSANDKSLTIRMIMSNPAFGGLNGAIIGLNNQFDYITEATQDQVSSGGVRLNLQNLIVNNDVSSGINITSWQNSLNPQARWVNLHAVFQGIYNRAKDITPTQDQLDFAKRSSGSIDIALPSCYQIRTK